MFHDWLFAFLERGECCADQCEMYEQFGQRLGLSPESYWAKVSNFKSANKILNLVQVYIKLLGKNGNF